MSIYITNLCLIGIYSLIYYVLKNKTNNPNKIKKNLIMIVTMQMILILGLRSETIGIDLFNYKAYFQNCCEYFIQMFTISRFEWGYQLLNIIIAMFTDNFQILLIVVAILSVVPVSYIIYKYSPMPFFSFLIYIALNFYTFNFSGLRQAIAFSIIVFAYKYIRERKVVGFLVCVLLASTFHISALVFLPAYWLYKCKINFKIITIYLAVAILTMIFKEAIMQFFVTNFYTAYSVENTGAYTYLLCSIIILLFTLFYKKNDDGLLMLFMIGVYFLIFTSVGTNMLRLANYYYVFIILLLPEVINKISDAKLKFAYKVVISLMFIGLYYVYLQADSYNIVPYELFFSM